MSAVWAVDFHAVKPQHVQIHERLENWSRWCSGRGVRTDQAPMFKLFKSTDARRAGGDCDPASAPVDRMDAAAVAKGVYALPEAHRAAINWCYLKPVNPSRMCSQIGTTMGGLAQLLHDGRQILINREV